MASLGDLTDELINLTQFWNDHEDVPKSQQHACRAEGMREAARINQDLARKYHGVVMEAWATVLCDAADAILSAIGGQK